MRQGPGLSRRVGILTARVTFCGDCISLTYQKSGCGIGDCDSLILLMGIALVLCCLRPASLHLALCLPSVAWCWSCSIQLVRFTWGRANMGRWILAGTLPFVHLDLGQLPYALMGYDVVSTCCWV